MSTWLDPERVTLIFMECLVKEGEKARGSVTAQCIGEPAVFHPDRLDEHKGEIAAMLNELPPEHQQSIRDWSFLNACFDKHGRQWTRLYGVVEQLYLLGIAIGKVRVVVPHEQWGPFPGGMTFLAVKPHA